MLLLAFLFACSSGSGSGGGSAGANNPSVNEDPPGLPGGFFLSDQDTGNGDNELWGVFSDTQGNLTLRKLSQPLVNGGAVLEFALDPAYGNVVAYVTDDTADGKEELWTVNVDGTAAERIAHFEDDINGEGDITEWHWAPDSCCIAYRADKDGDGLYELYNVDAIDISTTVTVVPHALFVDVNDVKEGFQWAPDGYYIAFRAFDADDTIDGTAIIQLYVYDVGTTAIDNVSNIPQTAPVADPDIFGVEELEWQPDLPANYPQSNPYLAYIADDENDPGELELYTVSLNQGGGWDDALLSDNDNTGNDVLDFKWHPKSEFIAYRADETNDGNNNIALYTVEPDGTGHAPLSDDTVGNGQNVESDYQWAPGLGLWIGYRANERNIGSTELFWAAKNGTGAGGVKVNANTEDVQPGFQWAPGGLLPSMTYDYIAYRVVNQLRMRHYLGEGGADPEIIISNNVGNNDFYEWAPLFEGQNDQNNADWEVTTTTYIAFTSGGSLYTRSALVGNNVMVSGVDPNEGNVESAKWSVEARSLVYLAEDTVDNADALYGTQADQSQGEKISGDVTVGGVVFGVTDDYLPVLIGQ